MFSRVFFFRFCLRHRLPFITHVQFAYQRSFVSVWQQQQWLVSDGATDGSVVVFCKCTNAVCVLFLCSKRCSEVLGDLSGAVEVASPWQCDRADLSLPVMDEHSQGEHLSFLSFLHHIISCVPLFHQDMQCVAFFCGLFSTLVCANEEFLFFLPPFLFFCFWRCFCKSMKMLQGTGQQRCY